jgi:hypothetical protein
MLDKLKFEAQAGGSRPEPRRIDLYDPSPPNVGSDRPLISRRKSLDQSVVGFDVHGSTLRTPDYASYLGRHRLSLTYCAVHPIGGQLAVATVCSGHISRLGSWHRHAVLRIIVARCPVV